MTQNKCQCVWLPYRKRKIVRSFIYFFFFFIFEVCEVYLWIFVVDVVVVDYYRLHFIHTSCPSYGSHIGNREWWTYIYSYIRVKLINCVYYANWAFNYYYRRKRKKKLLSHVPFPLHGLWSRLDYYYLLLFIQQNFKYLTFFSIYVFFLLFCNGPKPFTKNCSQNRIVSMLMKHIIR